jgi:hypothetical protein
VLFYGLVRAGTHSRQDGHRANVRPRFNANMFSPGFNANRFVHLSKTMIGKNVPNYMLSVILWLGKRAGTHPRQDGHRANVRPRFNSNIFSPVFNANIFVQTHDPQQNDDWGKRF